MSNAFLVLSSFAARIQSLIRSVAASKTLITTKGFQAFERFFDLSNTHSIGVGISVVSAALAV